jgi:hypothetical protein
MPLSYIEYVQVSSEEANYTFSFPYIASADIKVSVDTVDVPYTFLSDNTVTVTTIPALETLVRIYRDTEKINRLVDFQDGSVLSEANLDLSAIQVMYIAQEANDRAGESIAPLGDSWDGQGRKATNFLEPTSPTDLVTKNWAETSQTATAAQALVSAGDAATSAVASAASQGEAATSAAAALVSEQNAAADADSTAGDLVITNADAATTNANVVITNAAVVTTNTNASVTAASVVTTGNDATTTAANATAANLSAVAAAASEVNAVAAASSVEALPTQTDLGGGVLTTNGTSPSWDTTGLKDADIGLSVQAYDATTVFSASGILDLWTGTQVAYDALTPVSTTLYFIQ